MKYKLKMVEIGKRIKENRKEMGITQYDLLEKLHIGRNTLSSIENGKKLPDAETLYSLCEISNYTVINLDSLDSVSYQNALNEYIERLEKALDEACKRLAYEDEITCMHLKQQYAWAKNKVPKTKEQIKEELMKEIIKQCCKDKLKEEGETK